MSDAKWYPVQSGVAQKLVPMGDGSYAPAQVAFGPLTPAEYDYISLGYTGSNLTTVIYKSGGSGGTTISTLTLAYDGSNNLISVTKS